MHRSSIRFKCIFIYTFMQHMHILRMTIDIIRVYSFNDIPFLSHDTLWPITEHWQLASGVCDSIRRRKIKICIAIEVSIKRRRHFNWKIVSERRNNLYYAQRHSF